jgi:hypothetical protein
MFTRFKYDDARQVKELQEMTDKGRWILNTPGNGLNIQFTADPHIRMQKWGANLASDPRKVEEDLRFGFATHRGLHEGGIPPSPPTRDMAAISKFGATDSKLGGIPPSPPTRDMAAITKLGTTVSKLGTTVSKLGGLGGDTPLYTDQSRASHPAWTYRSQDDTVYRMTENDQDMAIGTSFQHHIELPGANLIDSRNAGKDEWRRRSMA